MREEIVERYHSLRDLAEQSGDEKYLTEASKLRQQWKLTREEIARREKYSNAVGRLHPNAGQYFGDRLKKFHAEDLEWQRSGEKLERKAAAKRVEQISDEMLSRLTVADQMQRLAESLMDDAWMYRQYAAKLNAEIQRLSMEYDLHSDTL